MNRVLRFRLPLPLWVCVWMLLPAGCGRADGVEAAGAPEPWVRYDETNFSELAAPAHVVSVAYAAGWDRNSMAAEARDQGCVILNGFGTYVRWPVTTAANALTLRYSVQDGVTGTVTLRVTGSEGVRSQKVPVTSAQAWLYFQGATEHDVAGTGRVPAKRYNEARVRLPVPLAPGELLELRRDTGDAMVWIDLVEAETAQTVPAPGADTAYVVTDPAWGAGGGDSVDDTAAFKRCIGAAARDGRSVFVTAGRFLLQEELVLPEGTRLLGAGMWNTELHFTRTGVETYGGLRGDGSGILVSDLYIKGAVITRYGGGYHGIKGYWGSGSRIERVWIEQTTTGAWIADFTSRAGTTTGLVFSGCRIRNTFADGINLASGTSESIIENCHVRGAGDDGLASWSSGKTEGHSITRGNVFRHNTIECGFRAGGIGIFGGEGHRIHHNLVRDQYAGAGIRFNTVFLFVNGAETGHPFGTGATMEIHDNLLVRTGAEDIIGGTFGAIDLQTKSAAVQSLRFERNRILDTQVAGVSISDQAVATGNVLADVEFSDLVLQDAPVGFLVAAQAAGEAWRSGISYPGTPRQTNNTSARFEFIEAARTDGPALQLAGDAQGLRVHAASAGGRPAVLETTEELTGAWTPASGLVDGALTREIPVPERSAFFRMRELAVSGSIERVALGEGGVALALPDGQHGPVQNPYAGLPTRAYPKLSAGTVGPVPTCSWWSSAVWDLGADRPYGEPLYAWPLAYRATATGFGMAVPTVKAISTYEYHWEFAYGTGGALPLVVRVAGMASPALTVAGWGDWTVVLRLDDGGRRLDLAAGMGLPVAWFTATGGTLELTPASGAGLVVWRNSGNELGLRLFGVNYLAMAPEGATWSSAGPFRPSAEGRVAVATLPDTAEATLARFRGAAQPIDSRISWTYDEPSGILETRYELVMTPGARPPPMALFPHQWQLSDATTVDGYPSPRGPMRMLEGGSFRTRTRFNGLLPEMPAPLPDARFAASTLQTFLQQEAAAAPPAGADTYWTGKELGKLAQLVPIARQAGRNDLADTWVARIRTSLNDWFDGAAPNLFRYDAVWSAVYGFPAGYQSNGWLQDHHFHWGYFLQAAALLAREDPAWADGRRHVVELLIRDTANGERGDATFPFLNSFEPYAGHAWASGPAAFFAGNNQESSSESLNFSAGLLLWGAATGNRALRDLGIFLLATETEAVHRYWLNDGAGAFPQGFNWPVAGIVWGNGAAYTTWFGGHPDHTGAIHAINFLPITPASLHLGRNPAHFLAALGALGTGPGEFGDILLAARATADPSGAADAYAVAGDLAPSSGHSRAQLLHWIHSLRQHGRRADVTCSVPTAGAFDGAAGRTYAVWNPGAETIEAVFSDGTRIACAPRSVQVVRP